MSAAQGARPRRENERETCAKPAGMVFELDAGDSTGPHRLAPEYPMRLLAPTVTLIASTLGGLAHAGSFQPLPENSGVAGLSHNGRIATGVLATGFNGAPAWRWTPEGGIEMIDGFVDAMGMSAWAQPIAGATLDENELIVAAVAYSNASVVGPVVVGAYPGGAQLDGFLSSAFGVSDDGVAVGLAYDDTSNAIAFRWSAVDGISRLPVNRPDTFSRANGISHDGSVAFGWNDQQDGYRTGVIWRGDAVTDLVDAEGNPVGEAYAASADGSVVVGGGYYTANGSEAWRWTEAGGVQPIGILPPSQVRGERPAPSRQSARLDRKQPATGSAPTGFLPAESFAFAVSDDGNTAVGASGSWPVRTASIWTPATGLVPLADHVAAAGVAIPDGWFLAAGTALSADGLTIGGWGLNPDGIMQAFIIDLHPAAAPEARLEAQGTVDFNDLDSGPFAGVAQGTPVTLSFVMPTAGFEIQPGNVTSYPIQLDSFTLQAGAASETLAVGPEAPGVWITNDYPMSDGIHLFSTPTASGQMLEFELFNPGGDMYDSDDLHRINRTFGPSFFEKTSWMVSAGDRMMWVALDSVEIRDVLADAIFADGFEAPAAAD